ncbi:MAG: AarF/ABC1/UbiB kinase family protein [Vulcanimicrobiaceae bacterium]
MDVDGSAMLRELLASARIVPLAYDRYGPLVVDGLVYFLGRLPAHRLDEIVQEQLSIQAELDDDERVVALLRRCPTLHKLGQVIGHDRGLPPEIRERLQTLESMPPSADFAAVAAAIDIELAGAPGVEVASQALAEGSVAIVVPFVWIDPPPGQPDRGVLKVVKPGVRERLEEELDIWPDLATHLEERSAAYDLPALDYRQTLAGVASLLRNEVRLDLEQERLGRARRFFAGFPSVVVPRVLALSTPLMTAMEHVAGRKITDPQIPLGERKRLASVAIEGLLAMPFWSTSTDAHFHGDPHAGNIFAMPDGRVALLDWALTTELAASDREAVVHALIGAATLDEAAVVRSIEALGSVRDARAVRRAVRAGMRAVRCGVFPGFRWFTGVLDELARTAAIAFGEETTLFRKALLTLEGVAADVSSEVSVDDVLVRTGIATFARELPVRTLVPFARQLPSHVSNADLVRVWAALPWLPARFWVGTWRDVLGAQLEGSRNVDASTRSAAS